MNSPISRPDHALSYYSTRTNLLGKSTLGLSSLVHLLRSVVHTSKDCHPQQQPHLQDYCSQHQQPITSKTMSSPTRERQNSGSDQTPDRNRSGDGPGSSVSRTIRRGLLAVERAATRAISGSRSRPGTATSDRPSGATAVAAEERPTARASVPNPPTVPGNHAILQSPRAERDDGQSTFVFFFFSFCYLPLFSRS